MNAPTKMTMAVLGGAAALAVTAGFGGLGADPVGDSSTTHPAISVAPARPDAATPAGSGDVHIASLTGCISGTNC